MKTLQDYPIKQVVEYVKSQGYQIYKSGTREGSLRHIRETRKIPKPCRETFQSRRKRRGGSRSKTQQDKDKILEKCFAMV